MARKSGVYFSGQTVYVTEAELEFLTRLGATFSEANDGWNFGLSSINKTLGSYSLKKYKVAAIWKCTTSIYKR